MKIELQYNPYLIATKLRIDGKDVTENGNYPHFAEFIQQKLPLQNWLDPIEYTGWKGFAAELCKKVSGEREFCLQFTGREVDFWDLKASIEQQIDDGITFRYKTDFILSDEKTAKALDKAVEMMLSDNFKNIVSSGTYLLNDEFHKKYASLEETYQKAVSKEFRIVFAGTYSSGKSTLINALIGKNLLPMADGTCTSKPFRIIHKEVPFTEIRCVDKDNKEVVPLQAYTNETELQQKFEEMFPASEETGTDETTEKTELPSVPPTIDTVEVFTDLSALYPSGFKDRFNLVLMDTPGTDTGMDDKHFGITAGVIASEDKEMVVLIVDATSDQNKNIIELLDEIDESNAEDQGKYNQRFLFALNKCDAVKYSKKESLKYKLDKYEDFIQKSNDENGNIVKERNIHPRLFPTAALPALAVKKGLVDPNIANDADEETTSSCYKDFMTKGNLKHSFDNFHLECYSAVSAAIRQKLRQELAAADEPGKVLIHTGIPSLQEAIKAYIERYAFPLKVMKSYETFRAILSEMEQLSIYVSKELKKISATLNGTQGEELQKKTEEREAEEIRQQLVAAQEQIDAGKAGLDQIVPITEKLATYNAGFRERFLGDILLHDIKNQPAFPTQAAADARLAEILQKIDTQTEDIDKEVNKCATEHQATIQEVIDNVNQCVEQLKNSGVLVVDGINVADTVTFQVISEELRAQMQAAKVLEKSRKISERNPEKNIAYPWYRFIKRIRQAKAPETISRTQNEYFIPVDDLQKMLEDWDSEFGKICYQSANQAEEQLQETKEKAKEILNAIERAVEDAGKRIASMRENLRQLSKKVNEYEREKDMYERDAKYLKNVRWALLTFM